MKKPEIAIGDVVKLPDRFQTEPWPIYGRITAVLPPLCKVDIWEDRKKNNILQACRISEVIDANK